MLRPGALVLDPTALPRRLGAHHGPADLHRPGLASTPGHLVSRWGGRGGSLPCLPPWLHECEFLTAQRPPGAQSPPSQESLQPPDPELCPPPKTEQQLLGRLRRSYS